MNPLFGWPLTIVILVALVAALGFLTLSLLLGVRRHYRWCEGCPLCWPR